MRELQNDDMFILSEIADKMNITFPKVPEILSKKGTDIDKKKYDAASAEYGKECIMTIVKKIHLAKNEVNKLIASVSGKTIEEVEKMTLKETITNIAAILKQPGVMDFFK
jgi:hypothetical protein